MDTGEKVRENKARRMAARQGMLLWKSRRRDPLALDYGRYSLVRVGGGVEGEFGSLDEVETWLTRPKQ